MAREAKAAREGVGKVVVEVRAEAVKVEAVKVEAVKAAVIKMAAPMRKGASAGR